MSSSVHIEGVIGPQYPRGTDEWIQHKDQYATSSYGVTNLLRPDVIVMAKNKDDIKNTISWARGTKQAIAIRTGGHQYSGASSTDSRNIQLDLSTTFKNESENSEDRKVLPDEGGKHYVQTSISWRLSEFNEWLGTKGLFVPHGQCAYVTLGGHAQTGGYGQLGRSFGLLGDYVHTIYMIDYRGVEVAVTKDSDPELFYALLGGSPGNLGVITHLKLQVHRDDEYKGSRGYKAMIVYNQTILEKLLEILARMSDNEDFPRNYDLCISVLSSDADLTALNGNLDRSRLGDLPEVGQPDQQGAQAWPRVISVWAQWVPFGSGTDDSEEVVTKWFEEIEAIVTTLPPTFIKAPTDPYPSVQVKPMSKLTAGWIFRAVREFNLPYIKRTYVTKSRSLIQDKWPAWAAQRVDEILRIREPPGNSQWCSAQFQCFGGKKSMFSVNANNGTSYSWRDTTMCATMDNFYGPYRWKDANNWQKENDKGALGDPKTGKRGNFSEQDRRVLWGSWGSFDLDSVWRCYYEDEAKYKRLQEARRKADPEGTFTPNTFCVPRAGFPVAREAPL